MPKSKQPGCFVVPLGFPGSFLASFLECYKMLQKKMWIPGSPIDDGFTIWLWPKIWAQKSTESISLCSHISIQRYFQRQHRLNTPDRDTKWCSHMLYPWFSDTPMKERQQITFRKSKAHCPWHKARRCTGQFLVLVLHSSAQQGTGMILKKRLQQPPLR